MSMLFAGKKDKISMFFRRNEAKCFAFLGKNMDILLTSSLKKHTFYNLLINNILYLCVT